MNPENAELSPKQLSALQALALSDIEEGMGHNVTRAQGLQEELAQRRASLLQNSAEAQALKGQEELLAKIVEEEMAHQMQVSVLSHLHLRQAEEIKAQSDEIKDCQLCWRNSKHYWNKFRRSSNRAVSLQFRGSSHQHPS